MIDLIIMQSSNTTLISGAIGLIILNSVLIFAVQYQIEAIYFK
jgi:hypothetical protein